MKLSEAMEQATTKNVVGSAYRIINDELYACPLGAAAIAIKFNPYMKWSGGTTLALTSDVIEFLEDEIDWAEDDPRELMEEIVTLTDEGKWDRERVIDYLKFRGE